MTSVKETDHRLALQNLHVVIGLGVCHHPWLQSKTATMPLHGQSVEVSQTTDIKIFSYSRLLMSQSCRC